MRDSPGFYGREKELDELERLYAQNRLIGCRITGSRRIGKSSLIDRFCTGKRSISMQFVQDGTEELQLSIIAEAVADLGEEEKTYMNLNEALKDVGRASREEKTIVVFDELPFLLQTMPDAAGQLQRFMDVILKGTPTMVIVCGSILTVMMKETEDRNRPLYERFPDRIILEPLPPNIFRKLFPGFGLQEAMDAYLILGGIPGRAQPYLGMTYDQMLRRMLERHEYIRGQIESTIVSELGDPRDYMIILRTIADGAASLQDIIQGSHMPKTTCLERLEKLESIGFIGTRHPMFGAPKRPSYLILDNLVQFYMEVLVPSSSLLMMEDRNELPEILKGRIRGFMGKRFELICRDYVGRHYPCKELGSWWGRSTQDGAPVDIDIAAMVYAGGGTRPLFCECKYTNKPVTWTAVNTVWERVDALKLYGADLTIAVFSGVGGFKENLLEDAEDRGVMLIGLEELLGERPAPPIPRECSRR